MAALPGWMPVLVDRINWGCSCSPWFQDLADEQKVLVRGRKIIFDLWPFIRELPLNISTVRAAVPEAMTAAGQLLERLGDSEKQYQKLFLQQFDLAGVCPDQALVNINPHTEKLRVTMARMCTSGSYADGIHAIVTAELSASFLSRSCLPWYERYFEKHAGEYEPGLIDAGLEWLRLHARTHTRHAIWMTRMLRDVETGMDGQMPPAALAILQDVLALWECTGESQQLTSSGII
jgi:hypothetical protein